MAREGESGFLFPARGLWRYGGALAFVAATTLVAEMVYRVFDTDRLSMVFLAGVLASAATLGSGPAYFTALAAFFVYDIYLVEPRFESTLTSAEDILVLIVFLAVAMLTRRPDRTPARGAAQGRGPGARPPALSSGPAKSSPRCKTRRGSPWPSPAGSRRPPRPWRRTPGWWTS